MRYQFSQRDRRRGGIAAGRLTFIAKTGIHGIPAEQRRINSSRGGKTQGAIQGAVNAASGQIARARQAGEVPRLLWARSAENRAAARAMGLRQGPKIDMQAIKTPASLKLGQARGGTLSRCVRWHRNRGYYSLNCEICLQELSTAWGILILDEI